MLSRVVSRSRPGMLCAIAVWFVAPVCLGVESTPVPWPANPNLVNRWPAEWERDYQTRVRHILGVWKDKKHGGTTYGESEKALYPSAMFALLNGRTNEALKSLQEEDNQAKSDHAHTLGIDLYWCFTLKGQVRKYFYFGRWLDPAHKQKMFDAARLWTEQEPLRREHPRYGKGDPAKGVWGPENKGSWVDVRNTDNLRAMRDTSVYLFAEETKNESTRRLYKEKLTEYVQTLYNIGMSEWDSPNYLGHAIAPYLNLYDFARDPEVQALGKAALDWLFAAGALKYRGGAIGGPNARDYGGHAVFHQGAAHVLWLYFGGTPQMDPEPERDLVHHITSSYRPPRTVVELAKKNFPKPCELLVTHPPYKNWKPGLPAQPEFFETQYIGETFQLGTCASASTGGLWNINAFTLVADNSARGADFLYANSHSAVGHSWKRAGDQIAQFRNLALWLRPATNAVPFQFQIPRSARIEMDDDLWFIALEKTWLALWPIRLTRAEQKAWSDVSTDGKALPRWTETEMLFEANTLPGTFAGFALEVGDGTKMSFLTFQQGIRRRSPLDLSKLAEGSATLTSATGERLTLKHNSASELPGVVRNGERVDWSNWRTSYGAGSTNAAPIVQPWMQGKLTIEAGGWRFGSQVPNEGKAVFSEREIASR